jgi:hypothetical protein
MHSIVHHATFAQNATFSLIAHKIRDLSLPQGKQQPDLIHVWQLALSGCAEVQRGMVRKACNHSAQVSVTVSSLPASAFTIAFLSGNGCCCAFTLRSPRACSASPDGSGCTLMTLSFQL